MTLFLYGAFLSNYLLLCLAYEGNFPPDGGGDGFGGLVVSMLASGTQDRGFDPGSKPLDFSGEKTHSGPSFGGGGVKPSPMSQICAACQRTLGLRGSQNHRQN